jgi:predicted phage terminase large subunit-like protein
MSRSRFGLKNQHFKNISKVDRSNAIKAVAAQSIEQAPVLVSHPTRPGETITLPPLAALLTERARRSFKEFVAQAWHVLEPGTVFCRNFATDAVCDHAQAVAEGTRPLDALKPDIEDPIRDLIINIPPRHAKSMIMAVFFPAWVWINYPEKRFMFLSFSHEFTKRDSRRTRQLMTSEWYQARWGDRFELTDDSNTLIRFDNSKGGFRYATSFNGQVTGEGADIIVVDDANNMGEIHSKKKRENVTNKWSDVISSRLSNPKTGCRIIIAQRGHGGDLTGYILDNDKEKTYVHLRLPAEFESKYRCVTRLPWADPRIEEGQLIDPRRFGPKEIARLKADMKSAFNIAAQLQQRPVPLEGGIFEHDWWQYYKRSELPPISNWLESCISVDMTFGSVKDEASFCVFQAWARVGSRYYLLGQKRGQWKYTKAKRELKAFVRRFHFIYAIYVENKALGPAIMDELMEEDGLSGIIPVDPKHGPGGGDKVARAHSVSPLAEAGNVYLPDPDEDGNEWVTLELMSELDLFPMAANDDQVDTLTQALRKLRGSAAFGTSPEDVEENVWLDVDILAGEKMFDPDDDSYLYPAEAKLLQHEFTAKLKENLMKAPITASDSFWSF